MMVELLAAALTGGHFSWEFDWSGHPGAKTPWTGQLLIVIDPQIAQGQRFAQRSRLLLEQMEAAGVSRMPGARRHLERERAQREGVAIGISTLQALRDLLI